MADIVAGCMTWLNAQVARFFFSYGGGETIVGSTTDDYNEVAGGTKSGEAITTSLETCSALPVGLLMHS